MFYDHVFFIYTILVLSITCGIKSFRVLCKMDVIVFKLNYVSVIRGPGPLCVVMTEIGDP